MEIQIRLAEPRDFKEVYNLIKEFASFIKTPEKVKITPEQMMKDEKYFNCIIAIKDSKIVGFATYFFSYHSWSGRAIYLDDLYVVKTHRNKGIGNSLFEKVKAIGEDKNCCKMKWQVSRWNTNAQEFYINNGAVIDDVEINCDLELV